MRDYFRLGDYLINLDVFIRVMGWLSFIDIGIFGKVLEISEVVL